MGKIGLALLLLLIGAAAVAQTPAKVLDRKADPRSEPLSGGQIRVSPKTVLGHVTDDQGRSLVGVQVIVICKDWQREQVLARTVTDSTGRYSANYAATSEAEIWSLVVTVRSHDGTSDLGSSSPIRAPKGTVVVDIVARSAPPTPARLAPIQAPPPPLKQIR